MTTKEKIEAIESVIKSYKELDGMYDDFYKITNSPPDSPLFNAVFTVVDRYINAVSELVGDDWERVSWYIFENNCGEGGMTVKINEGKEELVDTVEKLVEMIEGE